MRLVWLTLAGGVCMREVIPMLKSLQLEVLEGVGAGARMGSILLLIPMVRVLMGEAVGESRLPLLGLQQVRFSFHSLP